MILSLKGLQLLPLCSSLLILACEGSKFAGGKAASQDGSKAAEESITSDSVVEIAAQEELGSGDAAAEVGGGQPVAQVGGVPGGHFDLDTSIASYPFNMGATVRHVHEYDDKFGVTGVDFFKMLDSAFVEPPEVINPEQSFKILVANSKLSPGAHIAINGKTYSVMEWEAMSAANTLPVYSLGGVAGTEKLGSFSIAFDPLKPISQQLIPTVTNLVRSNAPGPGNAYRSGALTLQMIDAKTGSIDKVLNVATVGAPGMLWEATLFWHFSSSSPLPAP